MPTSRRLLQTKWMIVIALICSAVLAVLLLNPSWHEIFPSELTKLEPDSQVIRSSLTEISDTEITAILTPRESVEVVETIEENDFYTRLNDFVREAGSRERQWSEVFIKFQDPAVMNLERLTTLQAIESQRAIVADFLRATETYIETDGRAVKELADWLTEVATDNSSVQDVLDRYQKGFLPKKQLEQDVMAQHILLGETCLEVLDLLKRKWGEWEYAAETKTIQFLNPSDEKFFYVLFGDIAEIENRIENYGRQMMGLPAPESVPKDEI